MILLKGFKAMFFSFRPTVFLQRIRPTVYLHKKTGTHSITEKLNNTVVEKWRRYWEDLIKDYTDVCKETVENGLKNPRKTLVLCSFVGFTFICFKTNPDDINYRESVVKCSNDVLLVAKAVRNPKIDSFLTSVETCFNFGVIRRLSFGVMSVMWIDNYSNELGLFKTKCSHLKPQYFTFFNRIIDVGFLGRWWRLGTIMQDYDVNLEEWISNTKEEIVQVK